MDIRTDESTLVLVGHFDARSTRETREAIYDHLDTQDGDVVIDLTDVEFVDLTALRVLAMATRRAGQSGRQVTLRGCCPAVRRMLHLSRLIRAVEIERDVASA